MSKEFKFALRATIPVMCGYLFAGIAFGLLLANAGYGPLWALLCCAIVYGGSMQFVMIGFLTGGAGLLDVIVTTLAVQSRHIFYGISFVDKFRAMGKRFFYMVFSLTDETYSVLLSVKPPKELDERRVSFFVALLNHIYWIAGGTLGGAIGAALPFDTTGIDFAMTALFIVILTERWLSSKNHLPELIGLGCGAAALACFGAQGFLLPALIAALVTLMLGRRKIISREVLR